jgi:hypothetical protein
MGRFSSWMNNAATDFEGFSRWLTKLFRPGVATGWTVTQRGAGANMSVDVAAGDGAPMTTNTAAWDWTTAVENVTIGAASANNRRDIVVAYTDLSVSNPSTSTPNNPGALKFMAVQGTPASSPSDPSDPTIQAAVGASNPFVKLARVSLTPSTTQITNAQITDLRGFVALNVQRLWGGASNTLGHLVPNQADGTLITSTDTNSVLAAMLATDAITLGYAQRTADITGLTSASAVQITGLTAAVTIPAGSRKVRITVYVSDTTNSSGASHTISIWDGTVGSGTQLQASTVYNRGAGNGTGYVMAQAVVTPSAGAKTYNAGIAVSTGSGNVIAAATKPAFIQVEAV